MTMPVAGEGGGPVRDSTASERSGAPAGPEANALLREYRDPDPYADLLMLEQMEVGGAPLEDLARLATERAAARVERIPDWLREPVRDTLPPVDRVYRVWDSLAALRRLPDGAFDAVIADSPYSSGGFTRSDRAEDPRKKYPRDGSPDSTSDGRVSFSGDNRDARSWAFWSALWLGEALRVTRDGGYILSFADWRQDGLMADAIQAGGWVHRGKVIWDKGGAARAPHTGYFRHQCEYVVWGTRGPLAPAEHGGPFPGVISAAPEGVPEIIHASVRQDDKFHMTGKPTPLMRELVKCVPPGGLILDPFAGSGSTLVGAVLEGRRAVGFEREAANVDIANKRIAGARHGIVGKEALEGQRGLFESGAS